MKNFIWFISILVFVSAPFVAYSGDNISEKDLLKAVKSEDVKTLMAFLHNGNDINAEYGRQKFTLLNYSIKTGSLKIFKKLLLYGTDVNKISKGKTPLMFAVDHRRREMISLLISEGANIDARGHHENTALIYAAQRGKMNCVKVLVENGADAELINKHGFNALDYANFANFAEVAQYLVKIIEMRHFYDDLSWTVDGPHVEWDNDSTVRIFYMVFDTIKRFPVSKERFITVNEDTVHIEGFAGDTNNYYIFNNITADPSVYQGIDKVLAIGDVHGHYDALFDYLKSNQVIDKNGNWIFGNGHLVMLGDVFDRGDQVTESLWLINQLDFKARAHGGRVQMLLGNHEVMIMTNDIRYLNKKYVFFSRYFFKDYSLYFDENSGLGQWLRTRNAVISINGNIFSHAGISPVLYENDISINAINHSLRNYLADAKKYQKSNIEDFVLGSAGPLWYRGYLMECNNNSKITQNQVDNILNFYGGKKMVVAHTENKHIQPLFDDKVIAIDVPIRTQKTIPEGLLIENGKYYSLHNDGARVRLF
nr:ankyrin repeat domain-containing protein [Bacteroidota bacterium]